MLMSRNGQGIFEGGRRDGFLSLWQKQRVHVGRKVDLEQSKGYSLCLNIELA